MQMHFLRSPEECRPNSQHSYRPSLLLQRILHLRLVEKAFWFDLFCKVIFSHYFYSCFAFLSRLWNRKITGYNLSAFFLLKWVVDNTKLESSICTASFRDRTVKDIRDAFFVSLTKSGTKFESPLTQFKKVLSTFLMFEMKSFGV